MQRPERTTSGWLRHPRYVLFLAVLAVAAAALHRLMRPAEAVLVAFDLAVFAFVVSCVPLWRCGEARVMRKQAERDDAGQVLVLLLTAVISSVVLVALAILSRERDRLIAAEVALLVGTLLASWLFSNLIYAFHYARMYYAADDGKDREGIDFPGNLEPDFSDFVNFAFVIGMTCQTADIDITHPRVRRVATFQGLFAFAFNLGILALTVNMLASKS